MSDRQPEDRWEQHLRDTARAFRYPPTPDVARSIRRRLQDEIDTSNYRARPRRRWLRIAVGIAIVVAALLAVPEVRAGIRSLFTIGSIEIVRPTPSRPVPTALPGKPAATSTRAKTPTVTPAPTSASQLHA